MPRLYGLADAVRDATLQSPVVNACSEPEDQHTDPYRTSALLKLRASLGTDRAALRAFSAIPYPIIAAAQFLTPKERSALSEMSRDELRALVVERINPRSFDCECGTGNLPHSILDKLNALSADLDELHADDQQSFGQRIALTRLSQQTLKPIKPARAYSGSQLIDEKDSTARIAMKLWQLIGLDTTLKGPNPNLNLAKWIAPLDTDIDVHYGIKTATRSVETANVSAGDFGLPVWTSDKIFFFFGDTIANDPERIPGFFDAGESYAVADRDQNVFQAPPNLVFFRTTRPEGTPTLKGGLVISHGPGARQGQSLYHYEIEPGGRNITGTGVGFKPIRFENEVGEDFRYRGDHGVVGAFADGTDIYVIYTVHTTPKVGSPGTFIVDRSVLGRSRNLATAPTLDGGETFRYIADMPKKRMLLASPLVVNASVLGELVVDDLPEVLSGKVVLLFGTDEEYRGHSYVYLAYCPLGDFVKDRSHDAPGYRVPPLRYLQYVDYSNGLPGVPRWTAEPLKAMPLVAAAPFDVVSEISVVHDSNTGLWLMSHGGELANCVLRWAPTPWGPWGSTYMLNPATGWIERLNVSPEPVDYLWDYRRDNGFGNLLHLSVAHAVPGRLIGNCLSIAPSVDNRHWDELAMDGIADETIPRCGSEEAWPRFSTGWQFDYTECEKYHLGRFVDGGGGYGGFLVAPWVRFHSAGVSTSIHTSRDVLDVVYTLSTWNPYTAVLMSTSFEVVDAFRQISLTVLKVDLLQPPSNSIVNK